MGESANRLQARRADKFHALIDQARCIGQPLRIALAVCQIGGKVKALHTVDCRLFWAGQKPCSRLLCELSSMPGKIAGFPQSTYIWSCLDHGQHA